MWHLQRHKCGLAPIPCRCVLLEVQSKIREAGPQHHSPPGERRELREVYPMGILQGQVVFVEPLICL